MSRFNAFNSSALDTPIPRSNLSIQTAGGGGGTEGMIASDGYTTVSHGEQTFAAGNWSNFNAAASGTGTAMNIEMQWGSPAPANDVRYVGFSSFDTGTPWTGGSFTKGRILSVAMDFDNVSGIGAGGDTNGSFLVGIYAADRVLNLCDQAGTTGWRWGLNFGSTSGPLAAGRALYWYQRPFPQTTLGFASGRTVGPTTKSMVAYTMMLPDGQIDRAIGGTTYDDGSGIRNDLSESQTPFGATFTTAGGSNIIIGAWFGFYNKAQAAGTFYQMTYTLKYSIVDL